MPQRLRFYVLLVCFLTAGGVLAGEAIDQAAIYEFCQEDNVVEYATALFYFAAFLGFAEAFRRSSLQNPWFFAYALLFFAAMGEEISWGQRLLNIPTPQALETANLQGELNFHNINGLHQHIRMLALLQILLICYGIPLMDRFLPRMQEFFKSLRMPIYPLWAAAIPSIAVLLMTGPRLLLDHRNFNLDEVGEMYLGLAFLFFAVEEALNSSAVVAVRNKLGGK